MLLLPSLFTRSRLIFATSSSNPKNVFLRPKFDFLLAARLFRPECELRAMMWFVLRASALGFLSRL